MSSRENTEADLLDYHLRKLLYNHSGTYSFECGGFTPDIALLTNEQVKEYHKEFYHLNNISILLCGMIEPESVFKSLKSFTESALTPTPLTPTQPLPPLSFKSIESVPVSECSSRIPFPSSDDTIGSIGFGWRGPLSEDIFTITALQVLFRYLQGNPAAPLCQAFVERACPFASNVDFELKGYLETCLFLIFSGVPHPSTDTVGDSDDDESMTSIVDSETSESSNESIESMESETEESEEDKLFEPNTFHSLLIQELHKFIQSSIPIQEFINVIDRESRKILESLEEEPHETISSSLIPDILRYHLGSHSSLKDTRYQGGKPCIGTRGETLVILKELKSKSLSFWKDLTVKWLLEAPITTVYMIPDTQLGLKYSQKVIQDQETLACKLGKSGLKNLQSELEAALDENKIYIPKELIQSMPPIPDLSQISQIPFESMQLDISNSCFHKIHITSTKTRFVHSRFAFNTSNVSHESRSWLILFQESLFQVAMEFKDANSSEMVRLEANQVAQESSKLLISHEASLGFGNDIWTTGWLSDVFMIYANYEPKSTKESLIFVARVFLFSKFEKSRLLSIVKNLLSEISELKRDGMSCLVSISTRIGLGNRSLNCNDLAMSVFKQESFLKHVLHLLMNKQENVVIEQLNRVRDELLFVDSSCPNFAQLTLPKDFSKELHDSLIQSVQSVLPALPDELDSRTTQNTIKSLSTSLIDIWENQMQSYSHRNVLENPYSPFPFPRIPMTLQDYDSNMSHSVMVPISGLGASFLFQLVECDVMLPHPDYYPLVILIEILSRCEGPLYSKIRGQGFAYGASLNLYQWSGQLCFELSDSSDPCKALNAFYSILKDLESPESFSQLCNEYEIETAKASIAYRLYAEKSTSLGISHQSLKASLRGFSNIKEMDECSLSCSITLMDLQRVYARYLSLFLKSEYKTTFVTTKDGNALMNLKQEFLNLDLDFEIKQWLYDYVDF